MVITLEGSLDAQSEKEFQDNVIESVQSGEKSILLDFSNVAYVSSAGLRAILIIAKQQKESGGRLAACGLQESVAEIFSVSGFDAIVDVYSDLESGIEGLK